MGTPADKRKTVNLNGAEAISLQQSLIKAVADKKQIEAYIADLKKRIAKKMGDAEVLKINGVEAFTYAKTDSFAWAKFVEEHGDIAEKYATTVVKETYDFEGILRDHRALAEPFRSRQFLIK